MEQRKAAPHEPISCSSKDQPISVPTTNADTGPPLGNETRTLKRCLLKPKAETRRPKSPCAHAQFYLYQRFVVSEIFQLAQSWK